MKQSALDTFLNRLRLWQKFAILALFGVVLVAAPFTLYMHESGKTIRATRLETSGLQPMRLLMHTLQLVQQHRGLSMITLSGDLSAEARRATLQGDADRAFEALDAAFAGSLAADEATITQDTQTQTATVLNRLSAGQATVADKLTAGDAVAGSLTTPVVNTRQLTSNKITSTDIKTGTARITDTIDAENGAFNDLTIENCNGC